MRCRAGAISVLVLLLALFAVAGCSKSRTAMSRAGSLGTASTAKAATGKRTSLQLRATGNDAGATIRPRLELWAPFRIEATLGGYTASGTNWGQDGLVGLSVIDASFLSDAYGAVSVKRSGGGVAVGGETGGGNTFTPLTFDALAVDVAIEHDGTQLILQVRMHGAAAFQEVGRSAQTFAGPYNASLDVSSLKRGARVGVDDLVLVAFADPPDLSTPQRRARAHATRAVQGMLAAQRAADADVPDVVAAQTALNMARDRLTDTISELAAAGKSTTIKARTHFAATRLAVARALSQLKHGVPPRATMPLFQTMCTKFAKAVVLLP